ncbi:MAG: hypothetical protein J2P52_14505 [Blastocatellia bacterium]|nr:hypothetical protein [Blastocatellia bacterium]
MRRIAQELAGPIICVLLGVGAARSVDAKPAAPSENVIVPSGAEIMILTRTDLYSHTVIVGERLTFEVARDVISDGRVVIAKGAPIEAVVTLATPRKSFGRGGKLGISVETVTAVDGQKIKLRTALNEKGESRIGRVAVLTILGGALGGGLFGEEQKGANARIKAGTEIKVETAEEKTIAVDTGKPPAQGQDEKWPVEMENEDKTFHFSHIARRRAPDPWVQAGSRFILAW